MESVQNLCRIPAEFVGFYKVSYEMYRTFEIQSNAEAWLTLSSCFEINQIDHL